MDNFEWEADALRQSCFGLHAASDYASQKRTPKLSAAFYREAAIARNAVA